MAMELRKTGISVVGDAPWGTHFCHFYETKQDLLDTLVPYFKAGLESKEFCLWVVSNSDLVTVEEAKGALAQAVPDLDRHIAEENIEILNGLDWYLEENVFNLEKVTRAWDAKLKRALALGYDGMRVSGDTLWLGARDWKNFGAYEKQLNDTIGRWPMTALCTYPLAKSGATTILDVVQTHQFALARRQGEWKIIETPELIQAKAEIERLNEDLEQQVIERTNELRVANEELRKEIAERKQAEDALRRSEDRIRLIIDTIPTMAWSIRPDGAIDFVNQRWLDYTGLSLEEEIEEPTRPMHPEDLPGAMEKWLTNMTTGEPSEDEIRLRRADGEYRWFLVRTAPLRDEQGNVVKWYGVSIDIEDRKRAEEKLKQSETQLAEAQRLAHVGSWNWDLQSNVSTWSVELYRIYGVDPEAFNPGDEDALGEFIHLEDRALVRGAIESSLKTQEPFSFYYRIHRADGEERVIHSRGDIVSDEHGDPIRMFGTAQDVTERNQADDELRQQKEILQQIFDHIPVMINFVEADGRIKLVNHEWERTLGWSLAEIRQQNLDVFAECYPEPQYHQEVLNFIAEANGEWVDFKTRVRDGRVIDTTFVMVRLSDGTSIGIGKNITERKRAEEARREAEKKYKEIFKNAGEGIFQSTPDGRYIAANPALARMYRFASPEELIQSCQDISRQVYVDRTRREEFKCQIETQGAVRGFEHEVFRKDGSKIWISVNARAVRDEQGAIQYYEGTAQDITARKLAEQGLRESEERYRELFENAKDAIFVHDLDGRFTSVNRAAEKLTGYKRAEILGKSFLYFVAPEQIENIRTQLCRKLVDEGETTYESEVITKDGRRVAVEVNNHAIFENGAAIAVQGTARDITERKASEEKLKATSEQLRALSARLQSAREEEGTRIAREIHDELGSALASLKWDLEEMDKMLSTSLGQSEHPALREKLRSPMKLADTAISAIRRIASELRPSILDDLGLLAAIEWQAQQFQARTGIVCHCDCSMEKVELSEEQSTALFRILQEALTNVLRHAQATRVDIKISKEKGCLALSVSDNGKGITEREKSEQRSLGILGMRERAHLIGGEIEIKGLKGKGTAVIVRVPIPGDRVLKMMR